MAYFNNCKFAYETENGYKVFTAVTGLHDCISSAVSCYQGMECILDAMVECGLIEGYHLAFENADDSERGALR